MKNERLLALMDCLLNEGRKSAEELARRFEVSVRTIYRDMDSLCAAGIPIVAEAGSGGGFKIEESYRIDRGFLTPAELSDLNSILAAYVKATNDRGLGHSLGKLSSLGPRGTELAGDRSGASLLARPAASAERRPPLPPPLIADLSPWGGAICDPRLIAELRRAIAERRVVAFSYVDGEGRESRRETEPYSVVIGGAVWYLHAWCRLRGAFRLFKIGRMRDLRVLPERYDPWARQPIPQPFAFEGAPEPIGRIEVSVDATLKASLEEYFPGLGEGPGEDGRWRYRFDYPLGSYLIRWLLYFGPGLRVESPASLRAALARTARGIARANDLP